MTETTGSGSSPSVTARGDVVRGVKDVARRRKRSSSCMSEGLYDEVSGNGAIPGVDPAAALCRRPGSRLRIWTREWVEDPRKALRYLGAPFGRASRTHPLTRRGPALGAHPRQSSARLGPRRRRFRVRLGIDPGERDREELDGVAAAMQRLLAESPGRDLPDRGAHRRCRGGGRAKPWVHPAQRAEAVRLQHWRNASSPVPSENMETQGYGEQYLKVGTRSPKPKPAHHDPPHHTAGCTAWQAPNSCFRVLLRHCGR